MRYRLQTGLLLIGVVVALALPRALWLDRFATPDEPKWLLRSANFYRALALGEYEQTYQTSHPGVTVMWAGTLGFFWRYPSYAFVAEAGLTRPQQLERALQFYNVDPFPILVAGRYFAVAALVLALATAFLGAIRLTGLLPALLGSLLIAFDPFSIALGRLLHLDGLVSALMLLALVFMLNYFYRGQKTWDLLISGAAAGLAWLTKSPSLMLAPFFALLAAGGLIRQWQQTGNFTLSDCWRMLILPGLIWTAAGVFVFVALWPAMWATPLQVIRHILGEASTYAAAGHDAAVFFAGQVLPSGASRWYFYPLTYLWRSTPITLLGLVLAGGALLLRKRLIFPAQEQISAAFLGLFALAYMLFMGLGSKQFDRYLLPIFAPLDMAAAIGWVVAIRSIVPRLTRRVKHFDNPPGRMSAPGALLGLSLVGLQLIAAVQTAPYYFSYYNPILGGQARAPQTMMIGWGEGLDQAARYLNRQPQAEKLRAHTWYPYGPFSYFFNGITIDSDFPADPAELPHSDYVVIYYHQWQRHLPSPEFLDYFAQQEPEQIITIGNLEYARIYRMPDQ